MSIPTADGVASKNIGRFHPDGCAVLRSREMRDSPRALAPVVSRATKLHRRAAWTRLAKDRKNSIMAQITPNTPLSRRTAAFGNKAELIAKVKILATEDLWVGRLNDDKSWNGISNSKLMRLHDVLTVAKDKFGTRAKLIDALISAHGRAKDADYKKHFETWPVPRLMDALASSEKHTAAAARRAKKKTGPVVAKKSAASAKKPARKS